MLRIRSELSQTAAPKLILFKSWNETIDQAEKHTRMVVKEQDNAIERFSTALNRRNDNLHAPNFEELNDDCIARYVEIRQTGFFDVALEKQEALRVLLSAVQLKELKVLIDITSKGSEWFDLGIQNGRLVDTGKWRILTGNIDNNPVPHENYFTINHSKSPSLKMRIKATFQVPPKHALCVLRKGDSGHLSVRVQTGRFPFSRYPFFSLWSDDIGERDYERSPNPKNELTFELKDY
jgi:hypothetical protein